MNLLKCNSCNTSISYKSQKKFLAALKRDSECSECHNLKFNKSKIKLLNYTDIKAILFDLDGTLIDSTKDLHYQALNLALEKIAPDYTISYKDHIEHFNGLSTKKNYKYWSAKVYHQI